MDPDTDFLQQFVAALKTKIESRGSQKFRSFFAVADHPLLRKERTEQVRQTRKASTAVQTYAASDPRAARSFIALFREKAFCPLFVNEGMFLRSVLSQKKKAAKTDLSQFVPRTMEALLRLLGLGYVSSCIEERFLHETLHWKTGSPIGVVVQLIRENWSGCSAG